MTTPNEIKPAASAEALDGGRCAVDAGFGVWQPIETAPRTGKTILIYDPSGDPRRKAFHPLASAFSSSVLARL